MTGDDTEVMIQSVVVDGYSQLHTALMMVNTTHERRHP